MYRHGVVLVGVALMVVVALATNSSDPLCSSFSLQTGCTSLDFVSSNSSTVVGSLSVTKDGNLSLESADHILIETRNNSGLLLEGRVRLWVSGLDAGNGDASNETPICLMMNDVPLSCESKITSNDAAIIDLWKTVAMGCALVAIGFIVGIIIGIVTYRKYLTGQTYERVGDDDDTTASQLESSDKKNPPHLQPIEDIPLSRMDRDVKWKPEGDKK